MPDEGSHADPLTCLFEVRGEPFWTRWRSVERKSAQPLPAVRLTGVWFPLVRVGQGWTKAVKRAQTMPGSQALTAVEGLKTEIDQFSVRSLRKWFEGDFWGSVGLWKSRLRLIIPGKRAVTSASYQVNDKDPWTRKRTLYKNFVKSIFRPETLGGEGVSLSKQLRQTSSKWVFSYRKNTAFIHLCNVSMFWRSFFL